MLGCVNSFPRPDRTWTQNHAKQTQNFSSALLKICSKLKIINISQSTCRSPQKLEVGTNGRYASISLASAGAGRAALHTQVQYCHLRIARIAYSHTCHLLREPRLKFSQIHKEFPIKFSPVLTNFGYEITHLGTSFVSPIIRAPKIQKRTFRTTSPWT